MSEVILHGCYTRPVSSYLKSLAVIRLVSEQADSNARAWWSEDRLIIDSNLDERDLIDFFVRRYAPTPMVAPWNGGSGFYDGDITKGLDAIISSTDLRFEAYRKTISEVQSWPEMPKKFDSVETILRTLEDAAKETTGKSQEKLIHQIKAIRDGMDIAAEAFGADQPGSLPLEELKKRVKNLKGGTNSPPKVWWNEVKKARTTCKQIARGDAKEDLLIISRSRLPDNSLAWFDAATALMADGRPAYNPILGTGGNEGRLDFSNNFMQRLTELLIEGDIENSSMLLRAALFSEARPGMISAKIGQFDPGRAGGYNQGFGVETKNFKINPWDFVLALEGAVALSSSVCKKSSPGSRFYGAIPFTVGFSGVGFTSSNLEEVARAETWMPIWSRPTQYSELRYLLSEGRSQVGRRNARTGLDFTRAVSTLGVDRGIDGFERYAFLKRRGDSYVALPAGRLPVRFRPSVRILDDIDPILDRVDRFIRGFKNTPATFSSARRRIDEAIFQCSVEPRAESFTDLVCALGRLERLIAQRDRHKDPKVNSPLQGLKPKWICQCDDGGPEVRLAVALASIRSTGKVGPIRSNLAGVDPAAPWRWATGQGQRRWHGNGLPERLAGVLAQRMMDAERLSAPNTPIEGAIELRARDVLPFLLGETDDVKIDDLLWGFTLIDWRNPGLKELRYRWEKPLESLPLPGGWCAMKLLYSPQKVRGRSLSMEPRIISLLKARRTAEAVAVAHQRLRVSDLCPLPVEADEWIDPLRQLAGLLVPIQGTRELETLVLEEKQQTDN